MLKVVSMLDAFITYNQLHHEVHCTSLLLTALSSPGSRCLALAMVCQHYNVTHLRLATYQNGQGSTITNNQMTNWHENDIPRLKNLLSFEDYLVETQPNLKYCLHGT